MSTHSSILAWRIPMDRGAWLLSAGSQRVGHDNDTAQTTGEGHRELYSVLRGDANGEGVHKRQDTCVPLLHTRE